MKANGETYNITDGILLGDWLLSKEYDLAKTAVLLNGKVVPRAKLESTALSNSDNIEIVSFVGGG